MPVKKTLFRCKAEFWLFEFLLFALCVALAAPVMAQGGLDTVNTFMSNVLNILRGIQVVTVTIAIIYIAYQIIFKAAGIRDCFPILIGALLIGGASELAVFLLG
jgi:type IV secretion system protein VirB2/type IV secretion system protein PtlA